MAPAAFDDPYPGNEDGSGRSAPLLLALLLLAMGVVAVLLALTLVG